MNTDIHSMKMAAGIHIPKAQKEAAVRAIAEQPDREQMAGMLGLNK